LKKNRVSTIREMHRTAGAVSTIHELPALRAKQKVESGKTEFGIQNSGDRRWRFEHQGNEGNEEEHNKALNSTGVASTIGELHRTAGPDGGNGARKKKVHRERREAYENDLTARKRQDECQELGLTLALARGLTLARWNSV
jgi:hypothetical protein